MMDSSRWGMCFHNLPTYPPLYSNSPTPRPGVGGVPDWLGMAAMSFTLRTPAHPRTRLLSVATIAHRVSFRHRKCHAFGFYASLLTALRKRIKSASLHRVSVRQVALTPDDFPLCQTQCSTGRSVTPMVRQGHTQCSNRLVLHYRSLQAQCSRCARGLSVG